MWIDPAWIQSGVNALRAMLDGDQQLRREMIDFLFAEGFWDPERLKWDSAVARFNACMDAGKPEFFKLSELWALAKRFGRHQFFLTIMADLGYECRPIARAERVAELLERVEAAFNNANETKEACLAEMRRLAETIPAPRIDPAVSAGGRFCQGGF